MSAIKFSMSVSFSEKSGVLLVVSDFDPKRIFLIVNFSSRFFSSSEVFFKNCDFIKELSAFEITDDELSIATRITGFSVSVCTRLKRILSKKEE